MTKKAGSRSNVASQPSQTSPPRQPTQTAQYLVVLVTCPVEKADSIAQTLVSESLCACVNILADIRSVYRWQGEINSDQESLLVMKTTGKNYARLEARIKEIHPYEVPEVIALNIDQGSKSYLDWVSQSVAKLD